MLKESKTCLHTISYREMAVIQVIFSILLKIKGCGYLSGMILLGNESLHSKYDSHSILSFDAKETGV